jgi:hypothetical protein
MKLKLSRPLAAAALVALAAMGTAAQARDDVQWSLGVQAAPGVTLGVGNTRPVVVAPAPIYVAPQPVYVAPQPVYMAPRHVVVTPAPAVIVRPAPIIYEETYVVRPGHGHGHGRGRGPDRDRDHGHKEHDRHHD